LGPSATPDRRDMADLDDLDLLYATIKTAAGNLEIVVANAGGGTSATLEQLTPDAFHQTFSSKVHGTVFTVQKALPLLNKGAAIVVIGSTSRQHHSARPDRNARAGGLGRQPGGIRASVG
jgi:NAD(P)-dependent dehydrogenase (short-subunit alcohol dehydrogenase family)